MSFLKSHRFWMHVPVGVVIVMCAVALPLVGIALTALFIIYEINQDRYKRDQAHKDIIGAAFGVGVAGVTYFFLSLFTYKLLILL